MCHCCCVSMYARHLMVFRSSFCWSSMAMVEHKKSQHIHRLLYKRTDIHSHRARVRRKRVKASRLSSLQYFPFIRFHVLRNVYNICVSILCWLFFFRWMNWKHQFLYELWHAACGREISFVCFGCVCCCCCCCCFFNTLIRMDNIKFSIWFI